MSSCEVETVVRKKILLVDDAKTSLMMEQMILSRGAYEFITAKDGQEAVEMAAAEHPDLILMDIVMPKLDGLQACKQIREQDETSEIPIIMVTTRGEAANVEKGFENGCSDYVSKPINANELLSKVKKHLGE
jgi:DNA-binding response OmpR family regulator